MVQEPTLAMIRRLIVNATGIGVTLVTLGVISIVFAILLATRSHPKPYQESRSNVRDSVRVYRNAFGVPHIVGSSLRDVVFAQGYTHAQDRLWQMDFWRRAATGRTAEILGPEGVPFDAFMRSIDIRGIVRRQRKIISPTALQILQAYSDGVNAFIRENSQSLPFEIDALSYTPQQWTPEDCLIIGRALAFDLSLGFWSDIAYAQIEHQRGSEFVRDYVPRDDRGPFVLDSSSSAAPINSASGFLGSAINQRPASYAAQHLGHVRNGLDNARRMLGLQGSGYGSNCWVMRTANGSTIVANDPHLSASIPAKWYQNHITAPNMNVVGLSVPGIPLVVSGRNDHVAWGFTSSMIDDVDYVVELCDSLDPVNYYRDASGSRRKFRYLADTIRVAGHSDTIISVRATSTSRVISDHHIMRDPTPIFEFPRVAATGFMFPERNRQRPSVLTFRWAASWPSDEITSMYKICSARTVESVLNALSSWGSPALTFCVGSRTGSMGVMAAGHLPLRGSADPRLPIASWVKGADWSGVTSLMGLGRMVNPARGWVASANNRLSSADIYVSSLFEPSSRMERISELMRLYRNPTVRDVQMIQQDVVSPYAKAILGRVIPILQRASKRFNPSERRALSMLASWDAGHTPIDNAASIFSVFLDRLVWSTFEDELGQQLYFDWSMVSNIPLRRIDELLDEPQHRLWDDIRSAGQTEDMSWIVIRAFQLAIDDLYRHFRQEPESGWPFGSIHSVTFPHVFGKSPLMRPTLNLGPFSIGGSQTTINNTQWNFNTKDPRNVMLATKVVASMRVISSMTDSIQYTVLPGGASGQPLEAHYSDQMQLWLKGGYVKLPVGRQPDVSFRLYHVFSP
ncbi:MAG: penicillin acylase family protein [Candidatus Kapabacteria bacterium]|nr:penicillin acylase family protein [Candidatus Kapabacteria bacterium]